MWLETSNPAGVVRVGAVRINPDAEDGAPSAQAIFSFSNAHGVTVSLAGVEPVAPATTFRLYAEASAYLARLARSPPGSLFTTHPLKRPS